MDIFKCSQIYMKDETVVIEKINKIVSEGVNKLQFIIDFDSTITKQHENGLATLLAFEVFFRCKQLPLSTIETITAIRMKNGPIELDPTIPIECKIKAMKEIYEKIHESLQGLEFDRREIIEVVRNYGSSFRDNTKELFLKLKNLNIPVTVFSAGLGDIVKAHLQQEGVLYDNVNVIANYLKLNGKLLDGLDNHRHLIHPFNKHQHLRCNGFVNDSENYKNIVLMGDNVGDVSVTDESFEIFKDTFDIVLKDDQTMNVILDIVKLLEFSQ